MKRNKILLYLLSIAFVVTAFSCKDDDIDTTRSIFDTTAKELTGFDKWVDDNYRVTYNIQFRYKYIDLETDMDYNLIPANIEKVTALAQLIKFLWLDAYTEVAGLTFTRKYCPRIIFLVGSAAYKTATVTTGTAESGLKITLYDINNFDTSNVYEMTRTYFKTMHHEFAHILHQTKMYDLVYGDWGGQYYVGSSWSDRTEKEAAGWGFVSRYSMSSINEDFVEVFAHYVTQSDAWWVSWKESAGDAGWEIIEAKIEFVRDYMFDKWGLNIDELRSVVRRRMGEVASLELLTEF